MHNSAEFRFQQHSSWSNFGKAATSAMSGLLLTTSEGFTGLGKLLL